MDDIDIGIYVPYYSKLALPVEELEKHTTLIEGITVVKPEALLILKQGAELERRDSVKGEKDRIDIITLLFCTQTDFRSYRELLKKYSLKGFEERLKQIVRGFTDTKYVGLTPRELKLKKLEIMKKLALKNHQSTSHRLVGFREASHSSVTGGS